MQWEICEWWLRFVFVKLCRSYLDPFIHFLCILSAWMLFRATVECVFHASVLLWKLHLWTKRWSMKVKQQWYKTTCLVLHLEETVYLDSVNSMKLLYQIAYSRGLAISVLTVALDKSICLVHLPVQMYLAISVWPRLIHTTKQVWGFLQSCNI